jgi:hypothetical protein
MRKFGLLLILIMLLGFNGKAQVTLVPFGSTWKYLDNGTNQGTAWTLSSYSDIAWKTGAGKFGYGITGAATLINFGPDPLNKYVTTYFRKVIPITNLSDISSFTGYVNRDDGVRVLVNGREVYRNNLPTGTITYLTPAIKTVSGTSTYAFTIDRSAFIKGNNVIAVEVHQFSLSSNDMAFDLKLNANPVILTRGPYLMMGNQTSVTLRWRTDIPTNTKAEAGTVYGTYAKVLSLTALTTEHEVRVTGLLPNTRYFYRIGTTTGILQGSYNNQFRTAPLPTTTGKVRIAVFGDCGSDYHGSQAATLNTYLKYTGTNPAELMLLLGDNAYDNGTDADYQKNFFNAYGNTILKNHIIFSTPGNHDYGLQTSRSDAYYQNFTMPAAAQCGGVASRTEAYYSYDWGNIHFISLDSYGIESVDNTRLYDTLGVQVTWLKKDLAANTKKWVIAFWHHPPYSMGSHNSDTEAQMVKIRQNFIRILERNGVDLVLCGHSHAYERSYLLNNYYGSESTFNPALHTKSSSSAKYNATTNSCPYATVTGAKNHGTVYVVSGSAGRTGSVATSWPHNAMPFSFNTGGMLYLEVQDNRLDGKFLRQDGVIADQFTIMQNVNKTTTKTINPGETAQLKATWIGDYRWSSGQTLRSISVAPTQNTTYTVTDGMNCLKDVFFVKVNATVRTAQLAKPDSLAKPAGLLQLFPAQVKAGANITLETATDEEVNMLVTDCNGRQISAAVFSGSTLINTEKLATGIYLVKFWGKDLAGFKKFVVTN